MPKKIHAVVLMVIVFFSACATTSTTNRGLDRAIENMAQEISHLFPSETPVTVDIKDAPDNQLRDYIITGLNTHLRGSGILASAAQSSSARAQGHNQIAGYLISADNAYPFLIAAQDVPEPSVAAIAKTPVAAVAETPPRKKAFDAAPPNERFEPEVVKRDYYINALAVFNRPAPVEPPKPPASVIPALAQYINALATFRAAVAPPPVPASLPVPIAASEPPKPPASVIPAIAQYINALATFRAAVAPPPVPVSLPTPVVTSEPPIAPARGIPAIAQYINALATFKAAIEQIEQIEGTFVSELPTQAEPVIMQQEPPPIPEVVIPVIAQYINALATFRATIEQIGRVDTTPKIWLANDPEPIIWCERVVPIIGLEKADEIRIWHENLVAAIGREEPVVVIGREYLDPAKIWLTDTAIIGEHDLEKARSWLAELEKRLRRSAAAIVAEAADVPNSERTRGRADPIRNPILAQDGFEWMELDGGASIVRYIGTDTSVLIPRAIGGKAVISIEDGAFSGRSDMVNCIIPPSVKYIGAWAFLGCTGIKSIIIPSSVIRIGEGAFSGCYRLSRAVIPAGLTRIEDWTFFGCMSLLDIVIPEGITHIGERAFSYCVSLTSLTIPKSVTSIGDWAFTWDWNIADLSIENDATIIGKYAFSGWRSLPVEKVNAIKSRFNEEVFHIVLSGTANRE